MHRRSLLLPLLAAIAATALAEPPPYPHALPPWYEAQRAAIDAKRVTLDFSDTPLRDTLEFLAQVCGVPITLDAEIDANVTLRVQDLELGNALRLIVEVNGLALRHGERGLVVTDQPDKYPAPPAAALRDRIDAARRRALAPPEPIVEHPDRRVNHVLATRRITTSFADTPLVDAIIFVRQVSELNVVVASEALDGDAQISYECKDLPLGEAFRAMLATASLDYYVERGLVRVAPAEECRAVHAKQEAERAAERAESQRLELLMARALDVELQGKRPHEWPAELYGLKVVVGPGAWALDRPIASATTGATINKLGVAIAPDGLMLVVDGDTLFVLARPK